jgi:hypothetical protein
VAAGVRRLNSNTPLETKTRNETANHAKHANAGIDAGKILAHTRRMAKKAAVKNGRADLPVGQDARQRVPTIKPQKPSALLDTRVVYCGDNLEQLAKLPDACNSALRTQHSAIAVAGSFYYHCDWHASHYVKVMLDQIFGENNLLQYRDANRIIQ